MPDKMIEYRRILVCVFISNEGWNARYTEDYLGADNATQIVPEKFARMLFPKLHGKYIVK